MCVLPEFRNAINMVRDFRRRFGHYPHIFFPRTFNEKVLARKLFDRRTQLSTWADKHAVRDYVSRKLGPAVLPAAYHVTVDPSDIPFERLPNKYVVKPTHGSGWVYFVKNAATLNKQELIARCRYWLAVSYYGMSKEWLYKDIPPRILVQEYLEAPNGAPPNDYKLFVFAGKVRIIQVDVNRYSRHKRDFYDTSWDRLNCCIKHENCELPVPQPQNLRKMIEYAETLSDGVDFVRVDLYELGDRVYFGELTPVPGSGLAEFMPESWGDTFGQFWELPNHRFWRRIRCLFLDGASAASASERW